MVSQKRIHPAWLMLVACCFLQAGGMGTVINSAAIMIPSVLADLQFSQGSFMLYMTIQGFCMAISLPIAGRLLPRINVRILVSGGVLAAAFAYGSMGLFTQVWQWYIAGSVLGLAAFVFILPAPVMIANWFKKRTGLAMGLAMACSGIGGAIINPLGGLFIDVYGWRITYVLLACISCVLVLPFTLFVIRFKPADMGVEPYGAEASETEAAPASSAGSHASGALSGVLQKRAVASVSFVCLFLVAGILSLNSSFMQLLPTFAVAGGMAEIAALLASSAMIGNIAGKLVLGWLNDRLGARSASFCGLAVGIVAFLVLIASLGIGAGSALAIAGAVLFGAMTAMVQVSLPLIVRTAYGAKDYSAIYSYISMGTTVIGSLGITAVGVSFDAFSSYVPSMLVMVGASVLAAVLLAAGLARAQKLPRV